jgi:hypothetical protein
MQQSQLMAHCGSSKITRRDLKVIPTSAGSTTNQPLSHFEIGGALVETLSFRQISVVREEYAVSNDGMKMFGVLDLETTFDGYRFSIGIRNSNDKSMRLALTVSYGCLCVTTWRCTAISRLYLRSIRNASALWTSSRSAWTACSGTSNRCGSKSKHGSNRVSPTRRRS